MKPSGGSQLPVEPGAVELEAAELEAAGAAAGVAAAEVSLVAAEALSFDEADSEAGALLDADALLLEA